MESPSLVFAHSADYARNTGGWVYNMRLVRELEEVGWAVTRLELPAGFPRPDCDARIASKQLIAGLPSGSRVVADQICLSPLAGIIEPEDDRLRFVMVFHHPIAMEEGLGAAESARFAALERKALASCRLVIATSPLTADTLEQDYGLAAERIVIAQPGMEAFAKSARLDTDRPVLLSVGAVIPRKGYHLLIEAMAGLRDLPWRLEIVGDLDRAPDYVATVRSAIDSANLDGCVVLKGGLETTMLNATWRDAHIYVAASLHEGYGMAVAEAIARGLPTVTTDAGAVGSWLDHDAAIVVPSANIERLRDGIRRVLTEPTLQEKLRRATRAQSARFPTWADTARIVDARLRQL